MKCHYIQDCAAIILPVIVITIIIYFRSALTMPEATYRQTPDCQDGSTPPPYTNVTYLHFILNYN